MAVTCGCERNALGNIEKLCADHQYAEQRRCHGLIKRADELEARLSEVSRAYDVTFKRRTELELAIVPFVEFAEHSVDVEHGVWKSGVHWEPISTWLGPSDFVAVAKLKA